MIGGTGNERKGETHPLPQPCRHAYGIRREENLMQEKQIDMSLCRRQAGQLSSPCVLDVTADCAWKAEPSSHRDVATACKDRRSVPGAGSSDPEN